MIRNEREYRNLGRFETEDQTVRGYATTFDTYELLKDGDVTLFEKIEPTAFDGADMSDVIFLRDHEGRVLARTKNDSLALEVDDHGLLVRANLGLTGASREMLEDIRAGLYSQMSFAFTVAEDRIDWEGDDKAVRVITRFKKLFDVSAVAFPANPYTDIGLDAREALNGEIQRRQAERLEAARRERERKVLLTRIKLMRKE